ncbi:MAG TPA: hypothetical protein VKN63_04855 [Afifellaceae bacterium]|nr:hypothetical protein [Afifellaceae bacterium]
MTTANMTANLKALARASANAPAGSSATSANLADDHDAKKKAKARLNREIGEKGSFLKASLKLFGHVFVITAALLTTDWIFNNGLQTQLIYRGAGPNLMVMMKNKAYHVNAYVQSAVKF